MTNRYKAGETHQLEANSAYIQVVFDLNDPDGTIKFGIISTLEQTDDEEANNMSNMVAYLARGMVDVAAQNPEEVMESGIGAFMRDSMPEEEKPSVEAAAGGSDDDDGVKPGSVPFVYSRDYKLTADSKVAGKA